LGELFATEVAGGPRRALTAYRRPVQVAALEWRCPARMAAQAFKNLTKKQQAKVTRAIPKEIKETEPAVKA
jgi:hypothetical protein